MTSLQESNIAFVFVKPLLHCIVGRLEIEPNGARRFVSGVIDLRPRNGEYVEVGKAHGLLISLDHQMSFAKWLALDDGVAARAFQVCKKHFAGEQMSESIYMALMTAVYWMLESGFSQNSQPNAFYLNAAERGFKFHEDVSMAISGAQR